MKYFLSLAALLASVLLLSACPNNQPPTPGPKAPEPKASIAQGVNLQKDLHLRHHPLEIRVEKTL